ENNQRSIPLTDSPASDALAHAPDVPDSQKNVIAETNKVRQSKKSPVIRQQNESADQEVNNLNIKKTVPASATVIDSVLNVESIAHAKTEEQVKVSRAPEGEAGRGIVNESENDTLFDEVVIIGHGNSNKSRSANPSKALSESKTRKRVIPGNGWKEFEHYFEENKKFTTADSVLTGEEQVTFTVGDDGLPDSIKVLHSLSPSHDKEVIRLLENGPFWKVVKGNKSIRLKIIF
ncbi:MAG TPA: hypothetical protein VM101_16190, partial [Flavitalea sp.]|nr:hypothetical protein [Flavitalea sp.]